MKPSVNRSVHYVAYGTPGGEYKAGAHRAAIITEVAEGGIEEQMDVVSLFIINPTGFHFRQGVPYDPDHGVGTWHWAEAVG